MTLHTGLLYWTVTPWLKVSDADGSSDVDEIWTGMVSTRSARHDVIVDTVTLS